MAVAEAVVTCDSVVLPPVLDRSVSVNVDAPKPMYRSPVNLSFPE